VQEEEFTTMQKSDPAGTLRLLFSKRQRQKTTSSEHTTTDSAPSNSDISSTVRQDSLLLKLTTTFVHRDVLKQIEENPACAKGDSDSMHKGDPMPQSEPFIEAQNITNGGNQDQVQKDGNAPNAEQNADSLTNPEVKNKEVYFIFISKLQLLFESSFVLINFPLYL
jgi:hypothetical protein